MENEQELEILRKSSYNDTIEDCLIIFTTNSFDTEVGNTYIQDMIKKFKALKNNKYETRLRMEYKSRIRI